MRVSALFAMIVLALIAMHSPTSTVFASPIPVAIQDDVMDGASTWKIDNEHTSIVCSVSHFGLSFIYGRFNQCAGSVEMDFQNPDSTKFRFEIDPDSIDSNNASRDVQLRGPTCLDAAQYETITFESIAVKSVDKPAAAGKTKRTFEVEGNLTLHGETRKITMPIELLAMGNGPEGKMRCGFMSRFVVRRSDFGIDALPKSVGDSVAVTFCFQAVHQQPEPEEKVEAVEFDGDDVSKSRFGEDADRRRLNELFREPDDTTVQPDESGSDEITGEDK
ncbi:YceI family protein [Mariniblastus fucicola]|nr:YceI family protein [Mariniblastus fucicola]